MAKTNSNAQGQDGGANSAPGSQPAGPPPGGNDTQGQGGQNQGNQNPQGTGNTPGADPHAGGGPPSPPENRSGDASQTPPDPPGNEETNAHGRGGGKVKIVHDRLRNGKIFLSDGSIAEFNAEGIAEIEATEAERLLSIKGYERV
jgi:hypothetical protein